MFSKLSENRDKPKGKLANEMTIKNGATQYDVGRPEWTQSYQTSTQDQFKAYDVKYEGKYQNEKVFKSSVCFGTDQVDYTSSIQGTYQQAPPDFVKAKPLRDKQQLTAHSYSLGDDSIQYKTASMTQFSDPKKQQSKEMPTYKNYNQRVDIITGQVYDKNKRSYPFEGYSEDPQHKVSQNQTNMPVDLYVTDPITGRRIIRKGRE